MATNYRATKWTVEALDNVADHLNKWVDDSIAGNRKQFLLADFCFHSGLGFLPFHFSRYAGISLKLDEALQKAKEWQGHCLAKGALYNKLNLKMAILYLSNFHRDNGWEAQTQKHYITTTAEVIKQIEGNSKELVTKVIDVSESQDYDPGSDKASQVIE